MYRFLKWLLLAAAFVGSAMASDAQTRPAPQQPRKGVVRVKLQPEVARQVGKSPRMKASGKLSTGMTQLDQAVAGIKGISIRPMLPENPRFAAQRAKYGLDRWYVVTFDETVASEDARKVLAAVPGVEKSEVVCPMVMKEGNGPFVVAKQGNLAPATGKYPFNDPQLPAQWHYKNFGDRGTNVAGADINLFDAWKVTTGSPNVLVAIIDGGVDYRHEDLAANMYVNEKELNGTPGVDDDGNGYVDDIYGYNFCTNSSEIYPHSHGTHVAGTVAAVNNNGIGVGGVAGGDGTPGSGVRMISCQVFDSRSGSGDGDFAAALVYAAEMGASIAQCSWGWGGSDYYEEPVLRAIDYFTETSRSDNMTGGLCIFATGNNGLEGNFYPAAYPKVVSVTSMTADLKPASYSNYGSWVNLIAPGGLLDYGEAGGVLSTLPNNEYGFNEGTSMATPHVSGIAALILSKYGSRTFVNESLRTQLITSVNDFYGVNDNEQYRGLYGTGYIDAAKALAMSDGSAPEAVKDFEINAAQDYIMLDWTIPASNDNNVHHHIVYYSDKPFTAQTDLSTLKSLIADTKFVNSGDKFSFEIPGLSPLTTYYVAIQAINRWGKASDLSPVKSITTNAGPEMTVDAESLDMSSTAGQQTATASFNIGNKADGILKWASSKRTVSAMPASLVRPNPGRTAPFKGKLAGQKIKTFAAAPGAEYEAGDYPKDMAYFTTLWANIGENDRTLPNSMAQWFQVDAAKYPEGFNLTSVKVEGNNGQNPVIQIYKGDVAISSATMLQQIEYPYFAYGYPIQLNEQIWFAPGDSFWIVVHFEGNQEGYPLGLCEAREEGASAYSYMSNDLGKSWVQLPEALKGSTYESVASKVTWGITARSTNPDWSEVLELTPASGTVRKGETQKVEVKADGSTLVNGTYKFNILLSNNQSDNNEMKLPVEYTVSGHQPDIVMPRIVDFGSLLTGQTKTLTVEAYNRGYGKFSGSEWGPGIYSENIKSSSENFAGPEYIQEGFPARTKTTFEVSYTPKSAGSHTGTITFTDKDGKEVRLIVRGVATDPARLALDPAVVEADTLTVGEPKTMAFKIANEGKYPLEFVFPKFSSETVENAAAYHKFGYNVFSNLPGYSTAAYDGNPALIGGTDVSSQFSDDVVLTKPIALGFTFPYYGGNYEKVYITSFGGIMFAPNGFTLRSPLTPDSYGVEGTGLISAYGSQLMMSPSSKVEYAKADGKFVVKFTDVLALVYDKDYIPVSFRIVLSSNGDIEIFYDNYDPDLVFQNGSALFCGINDMELADCLTLTSSDMSDYWGNEEPTADNRRFSEIRSGTAIRFEAPKPLFVKALSVSSGIVNPGESVDVMATLAADGNMDAGATYNDLAIMTNDPAPRWSSVRINAVIAGDGLKPEAALEQNVYDMGDVFRTSDVRIPVAVKNAGHDVMQVSAVKAVGGKVAVEAAVPFDLKPGAAKDIVVTVPTDREGAVADEIVVSTSAGELRAQVKANVIGCPEMKLGFNEVTATVESGTPLHKDLTVSNPGNETLRYAITPDPLVRMTLPDNADATTTYTYAFSGDNSDVKYEWIDIETNGLGEQYPMTYYNMHDYVAVDLPFEFPFYGKKYKKMYIYNTGFVSFTERHDDRLWPEPPADFPQGSVYTNIIAPYWGMHSMDQTKTAGTYHYVTDERVIVSFMEYGNSMNLGVCFQLVMEKDGQFRFAYKAYDENATLFNLFGLAGICNLGGSQSIRLPERMVSFGSAVSFSPVVEAPLAPGKSETVGLDFDTDRMAGDYTTALRMATNVPGSESIEIPVNLTVTGQAEPVWPADITVEHTVGYVDTDPDNPFVQMGVPYDAPFSVANNGTATFTITGINVEGPTVYDEWLEEYVPVFYLFVESDELDWITGEPTGRKTWQQYMEGKPIQVGSAPVKFSVPMVAPNYSMVPGEHLIKLTFYYTDGEEEMTRTVNVKYIVTPAPVMTLDKETIHVEAADDDSVSTETLTIGNTGEYKLTYSLRLDPTGKGEEIPDLGGGGIAHWIAKTRKSLPADMAAVLEPTKLKARKVKAKAGETSNSYDVPTNFDYTRALFYPTITGTNAIYNYGSQTVYDEFKAATSFVAPAEGFNVSHIYMPVTIGTATNYTLRLELVQGADPDGENVLGRGQVLIESQANPVVGQFFVIELEKPVYLNPGEEFCVVANYPAGVAMPAYLGAKEEAVVSGRYMAWTREYGWYDAGELFKEQNGSLGWLISCIETKAGQPWIRILNEQTEGEVAVGGKAEIKLAVNAASARMEKNNTAMLVIKSNDPDQPVVNFPVVLDCNGRPVITAPQGIVSAKEGTVTAVAITVEEPEGDTFTITFDDKAGHASVASVVPAEGDKAAVTRNEDGTYTVAEATMPVTVNVEIAPDYGTASAANVFTLSAADHKNHRDEVNVRYDVQHVNRAPEAIESDDVKVAIGKVSAVVDFSSLFTDPDGDRLTYTFSMPENAYVDAFTTDFGVVFSGKKKGTAEATVTATDPENATATAVVKIEVSDYDSVDSIYGDAAEGELKVMPNPVEETLRALCGFDTAGAEFRLYSTEGQLMAKTVADVAAGSTVSIDVADLPAGIYILTVRFDGRTLTARVIKR